VFSLGGYYFVGRFLVALVHPDRAISLTGINVDIASDSELPFAIEVQSICSASTSQPRATSSNARFRNGFLACAALFPSVHIRMDENAMRTREEMQRFRKERPPRKAGLELDGSHTPVSHLHPE